MRREIRRKTYDRTGGKLFEIDDTVEFYVEGLGDRVPRTIPSCVQTALVCVSTIPILSLPLFVFFFCILVESVLSGQNNP